MGLTRYRNDFGKPAPALEGELVQKNLSLFQKEYAYLRQTAPHMDDYERAVEALKRIPFGKWAIDVGYANITVTASFLRDVVVNGETLITVPTQVEVTARPNQDRSEAAP